MSRVPLTAILALCLVADARAGIIIPTGLSPGDQFRIVFVTTTTTDATSSALSYYDSLVQGDAAAAGLGTFNGSTVTWEAIGSTATVNAVSRLPTDNVPIYLADGTEVAAGGSMLWGTMPNNTYLLSPIDETATGSLVPSALVWTGTNSFGDVTNAPLGHPAVTVGSTSLAVSEASSAMTWVNFEAPEATLSLSLYGFSSVLTVPQLITPVPEPASLTLMLAGIGGLLGFRLTCRHRAAGRPAASR
jgi:hypothetical protein